MACEKCGMPMEGEEVCKCNPAVCIHCCECSPSCEQCACGAAKADSGVEEDSGEGVESE